MAFSRVQGNQHQNGASSSTTVAVTISAVGSGGAIHGFIGWASTAGDTITGVTDDKGNTYTLVDLVRDTITLFSWQSFYLENITNAPITITATISTSRTFAAILVDEYSGEATSSGIDGHAMQATNPAPATDAIKSGAITTTVNGDLIYGGTVDVDSRETLSAGTGFTGRVSVTSLYLTEDEVQATAGLITNGATFTPTGANTDHYITGVMAFKAAVSGAGQSWVPIGGGYARLAVPIQRGPFDFHFKPQSESFIFTTAITTDAAFLCEILGTQNADGGVLDEVTGAQLLDLKIQDEATAAQRLDATTIDEVLAGLRSDLPIPTEFIAAHTADRPVPVEFTAVLAARDALIYEEVLAGQTRDVPAYAETLATARSDNAAPVESLSRQTLDRPVPAEFIATVSGDRAVPGEDVATMQAGSSVPLEKIGTTFSDGRAYDESLVTVQPSHTIWSENLAAVQSSSLLIVENLLSVRQDGRSAIEFAALVAAIPGVPVEWGGALVVITDGVASIEWTIRALSQAAVAIEELGIIRGDSSIAAEFVLGVTRDISTRHEWLLSVRQDSAAWPEWTSNFTSDRLAPLEFGSRLISQFDVPLEYLTSVLSDRDVSLEDLIRVFSDRVVQIEDLLVVSPQSDVTGYSLIELEWESGFIITNPRQILVKIPSRLLSSLINVRSIVSPTKKRRGP